MSDHTGAPVEDYTSAFLVSAFVLLFSTLLTLWALAGYIPALVLAAALHILIPTPRG